MKTKKRLIINYVLIFIIGFLTSMILFDYDIPEKKKTFNLDNNTLKGVSNVVAVNQYELGVIGKANVEISPGLGRVLINTNPFLEPDTQYSMNIAAQVASNITKVDLSNKDLIINFKIKDSSVLGGDSASAILTILTIYTLQNKTIPDNIFMTGSILPDGRINFVGSVLQKGEAIPENSLFLIPKGQNLYKHYEINETKEELKNGKILITQEYIPREVNIMNYLKKESNITVIEVFDIYETINEIERFKNNDSL